MSRFFAHLHPLCPSDRVFVRPDVFAGRRAVQEATEDLYDEDPRKKSFIFRLAMGAFGVIVRLCASEAEYLNVTLFVFSCVFLVNSQSLPVVVCQSFFIYTSSPGRPCSSRVLLFAVSHTVDHGRGRSS
jgi:hypothetical protein